ncbi:DUF4276 family protein [Sulfurospirillum cavolei]|uniref:DUF4276 family protein n=1 Tax=Sulfurospirillum cavolei TaxID=366522 RepID=UPI0005A67930|nr:DUF4276 family protein [Sulfurospirillum cavolei]
MTLVFLLEEASAKEMLQGILPRLLPTEIHIKFIVFEGKSDLEKRLKLKIQGWKAPDSYFIILRDQDSGDCKIIKQNLVAKCVESGRADTLVRIVCHELESWYLGDLGAVEKGLKIKLQQSQTSTKFRNPDLLANAAEELEKITKKLYQKVGGSRDIAPHLNIAANTSISFNMFIRGIQTLVEKYRS